MKILDVIVIKWLHIWAALVKRRECPPACSEGHTYQWPCGQRIKTPKKSKVGAWRDANPALGVRIEESAVMPEAEMCTARRAASYGIDSQTCRFTKGHEGPHSWVATV